ncbi:hypothetical protein RCG23_14435 [Neobacillus sp. PS3-34]|uniref:hypothetical protein n=1 Tax=Neobacillus sp. PS3-34 TaxID=3070678 RepID=UPI0027E07E6E|nr:hypothetical protein [Neobacillus sp. PS3-34]WML46834.1 hypothetical protein RCG23_14435 [Neobacillus sp. PS3-34]
MLTKMYKVKYAWHLIQTRYNEVLIKDCLCQDIKSKLIEKVSYHRFQADRLTAKL